MFFQTDPRAPKDFQESVCLFSIIALSRFALRGIDWTIGEAIHAWSVCRAKGYITGDLNTDGDYDDAGEDEIVPSRYNDLFRELGAPLRYVDPARLGLPMGPDALGVMRILPVAEALDPRRWWVVEAWRWKYLHFVKGDGRGKRPVQWDSIEGGSYSVQNGRCESLRVFEIVPV